MRVLHVFLVLVVAAIPTSAASAEPGVDAGVVRAEVVAATPGEECAVPRLPGDLCPLYYDDGGTEGEVGDDTASTSLYVDEVAFAARTPLGVEHQARVDYHEVAIEHPLFRVLNRTWIEANDTLPNPVKEVVTLESRPMRDADGEYTEKWGLWLMYHSPIGDPTDILWEDKNLVHFCWSMCDISPWHETNYTHVRPFPDGIVVGMNSGIEYEVTGWGPFVYGCFGSSTFRDICDEWSGAKPYTDALFDKYLQLTPDYRIEMVQWNRTTVQIVPLDDGGHASGDNSPVNTTVVFTASGASYATVPGEVVQPRRSRSPAASPPLSPPAAMAPTAPSLAAAEDTVVPAATPTTWNSVILATAASLLITLTWWLLYSRINRSKALNHRTRQHIHDILEQEPGLKIGTLATRLNLDYHTVKHHVETLHRVGFLRATGRAQKRYFTATTAPAAIEERSGSLSKPSTRRVLRHVRRLRRIEQRQLQEDLGLAASTVSEAVAALREAGLVEDRRAGPVKVVSVPTAAL